jgi:hypothetical protein
MGAAMHVAWQAVREQVRYLLCYNGKFFYNNSWGP